jgi:gas vesicle protein
MIVPILISGAIGAGLALYLTPKPGREIRSNIARLAKRGTGQGINVSGGLADRSVAVESGEVVSAPAMTFEEAMASGRSGSRLVPILVSGVVGAAVALLFAPKSGSELLRDTRDFTSSMFEQSKGWYEQGAQSIRETVGKAKDAAVETGEKLKPAA